MFLILTRRPKCRSALRLSTSPRLVQADPPSLAQAVMEPLEHRRMLVSLAGPLGDWTATFGDEFNGSSVNASKWNTRNNDVGSAPDGKSRFDAWYPQTTGPNPEGVSNVSVGNGVATITAKRESWYPGTSYGKNYSTGILQSSPGSGLKNANPGHSQTYGYFEARLRGPQSNMSGTDFGMWLYNKDNWPPEIDVVEMPGNQNGNQVMVNRHFRNSSGSPASNWKYISLNSKNWNTYGVQWEPGLLVWYINGNRVHSIGTNVPNVPMFMNVALEVKNDGGQFYGPLSTASNWTTNAQVDYVRTYQRTIPSRKVETDGTPVSKTAGVSTSVTNEMGASNGQYTFLNATGTGQQVTWRVPNVQANQTYDVYVGTKVGPNRGRVQMAIVHEGNSNWANHGSPVDLYSPNYTFAERKVASVPFGLTGNKLFRFTTVAKNGSSSGHAVPIDYIRLIPTGSSGAALPSVKGEPATADTAQAVDVRPALVSTYLSPTFAATSLFSAEVDEVDDETA